MFVTHKNSQVYYNTVGKGNAIVLLHGFLETSEMWEAFIPQLSENNQVICIDLLGHGQTDSIGYIHGMGDMADAVFSVLKALKIEKIACIGHSMGGYVALALVEKYPELVEDLCLMNSTFEADDNERKVLRARAARLAETNYENLVRMSFTNLFPAESKVEFKTDFDKALKIALKTSRQGFIAGHKGMAIRPNRFAVFKSVKGKKAIVIGEQDWIVDQELLEKKTKSTDTEILLLSGGHMSHIDNKSELSYFLKRFSEK
jgi:pimeloyl-ACP methyl ester carboxylesterase